RLYDDWRSTQQAVATSADVILVGSLVADGPAIVDWLATLDRPLFFYDIDTPITLTAFSRDGYAEYLRSDQVALFETYFSFAGGPALDELESVWGARCAEALYCGVDTSVYRPVAVDSRFECLLSYVGTYAKDRQAAVEEMLLAPARKRLGD